jgi:hypothetical protein
LEGYFVASDFSFRQDGFVILRNCLSVELISQFEQATDKFARNIAPNFNVDHVLLSTYELFSAMEMANKSLFKTFIGTIAATAKGFQIALSEDLLNAICTEGSGDPAQMVPGIPGIFFNSPLAPQLHYEWHQERSYYPTHGDGVITAWTPLFRDVTLEDGPMLICRGSHTSRFPYSVEFRDSGLMQLAVTDTLADAYEQIPCAVARGDVILFNAGALHKTGSNESQFPRINLICRYYPVDWGSPLPLASVPFATRDDYIRYAKNSDEFI